MRFTTMHIKQTEDGFQEASVVIHDAGIIPVKDLTAMKDKIFGHPHSRYVSEGDYECEFVTGDGTKETRVRLRYNPNMSQHAQLKVLNLLKDAIFPTAFVTGVDMTGMHQAS